MKVLYVTSNGGIHDYRFLSKLVNDYEVTLLHYAANELMESIKEIQGLKIISKKSLKKSFPLLSEYFHFKKVLQEFKPDIVHSGYVWQTGILAALANFHPHLSMPWGSDILIDPNKSFLLRKLVSKTLLQADHVQCDAEEVKNVIVKKFPVDENKISVFPWGIDLDTFKPLNKAECHNKLSIDTNKFVVLFNRHLKKIYGVKYLLEGYKEFAEKKNDVLLLLLSSGEELDFVKTFVKQNELENKIRVVGNVPNDVLPEYLNASDVYISTSFSDGTSLSLLEAMACGLGIIVTDVPAIMEWITKESGIIIQKQNSDDVCLALNSYYSNRELISHHVKKNLCIIKQRADWDQNYLKLKHIYENIT